MSDEVKSMNNALAQLFNKQNESLPGSLAKIQYLESWVRAVIRDEMEKHLKDHAPFQAEE